MMSTGLRNVDEKRSSTGVVVNKKNNNTNNKQQQLSNKMAHLAQQGEHLSSEVRNMKHQLTEILKGGEKKASIVRRAALGLKERFKSPLRRSHNNNKENQPPPNPPTISSSPSESITGRVIRNVGAAAAYCKTTTKFQNTSVWTSSSSSLSSANNISVDEEDEDETTMFDLPAVDNKIDISNISAIEKSEENIHERQQKSVLNATGVMCSTFSYPLHSTMMASTDQAQTTQLNFNPFDATATSRITTTTHHPNHHQLQQQQQLSIIKPRDKRNAATASLGRRLEPEGCENDTLPSRQLKRKLQCKVHRTRKLLRSGDLDTLTNNTNTTNRRQHHHHHQQRLILQDTTQDLNELSMYASRSSPVQLEDVVDETLTAGVSFRKSDMRSLGTGASYKGTPSSRASTYRTRRRMEKCTNLQTLGHF